MRWYVYWYYEFRFCIESYSLTSEMLKAIAISMSPQWVTDSNNISTISPPFSNFFVIKSYFSPDSLLIDIHNFLWLYHFLRLLSDPQEITHNIIVPLDDFLLFQTHLNSFVAAKLPRSSFQSNSHNFDFSPYISSHSSRHSLICRNILLHPMRFLLFLIVDLAQVYEIPTKLTRLVDFHPLALVYLLLYWFSCFIRAGTVSLSTARVSIKSPLNNPEVSIKSHFRFPMVFLWFPWVLFSPWVPWVLWVPWVVPWV